MNQTDAKAKVKIVEKASFGGMPIFAEGYGIPSHTKNIGVTTQWVGGILDDLCVSIVGYSKNALKAISLFGNEATLLYQEPQEISPGKGALAVRTIVVSRGGMTPVVDHVLQSKGFDKGLLRGVVRGETDRQPVANADVMIGMWRPSPEGAARRHTLQPFAIARTDRLGRYQIPLPEGEYDVRVRAPGRPVLPKIRVSAQVLKEPAPPSVRDIDLPNPDVHIFEVFDADTKKPIPAKVRIETIAHAYAVDLGPPWKAAGRSVQYLAPGPNSVTLLGGRYKCVFSRGVEYNTVTKNVTLGRGISDTVRVELQRVVPTEGMVSLDLNLATDVSPSSRVSAEDLVLAAAGEGVEWIVSGDLGRVTDLRAAIESQGLAKWLRASAGVHLSYQFPRLFGEFYVFPVPPDTPAETIAGLAQPGMEPADFFRAVRKAFPGALISLVNPSFANASYLQYYGFDGQTARSSFGEEISMDFDAIEVFEGKSVRVRDAGWLIIEQLLTHGHAKIPLSASKPAALYRNEIGFPRTYLVTGEDDVHKLTDADMTKALRERRFFITNGPIIRHKIDGKWPVSPLAPANGEFMQELEVLGAPWTSLRQILVKKNGANYRIFRQTPGKDLVKFPKSDEAKEPYKWSLHYQDPDTDIEIYRDAFMHVTVEGPPVEELLTGQRRLGTPSFAITPPLLWMRTAMARGWA